MSGIMSVFQTAIETFVEVADQAGKEHSYGGSV